jgi:hypothetical protein
MPDCGCKTVCYDQEFPGLPPDGECRLGLPRYRVCTREPLAMGIGVHRIVKLTQNAEYGKGMQMEPMQPMDAVSKYPDDMIPRITLRDPEDAILLIQALRLYQNARSDELQREAKRPGADQIALSLTHINETQYVIDLMTALTDGIIPVTTSTEKD